MPTGYTNIVAENENYTFPEFALRCARNFDMLIDMRDEPLDAPIPEEFKPRDYYREQYEKAKTAYNNFLANSSTEEDLETKYKQMIKEEVQFFAAMSAKNDIRRRRYYKMLLQVLRWQPPTPEHEGLREFMISQLRSSIDYDCIEYAPRICNKEEYIANCKSGKALKKELDFCAKQWQEEIERVRKCNRWLKDLRESLKEFEKE